MAAIDPNKVNLSEKDIEDWLWENPQALKVKQWVARQLRVPSGIIDLFGIEDGNRPVVVEVKNVEVSEKAILQVCRYAADIQHIVSHRIDNRGTFPIRKVVVCRGDITDDLLYEARSVNVQVHRFVVDLSLQISGPWFWSQEKIKSDFHNIKKIAESDIFEHFDYMSFWPYAEPEQEESDDLPEPFKEFLDKKEEDDRESEE